MLSFPIETILFDLDGTLRHNIPSMDDTAFRIVFDLGAVDDPEVQTLGTRWAHYYWAQSDELAQDMARFGGPEGEFWTNYSYRYLRSLNVAEELAVELSPNIFKQMESEYDSENHVYPCVPETLDALREAGFTLGLVSNRSKPCQEECEELGLAGHFDFMYVAGEVDAWKPNPRIFDRALELSGSLPEYTLYVGDNYYADFVGAKNAGLQSILLDEDGIFPEVDGAAINRLADLVGLVIR